MFSIKDKDSRENSILANLTLKSKLQCLIFAVSLVSIVTVGSISWTQGRNTLKNKIFQQLTSVRTGTTEKFELYFNNLFSQVSLLAQDKNTVEAMVSFNRGFRQLNHLFIEPKWEESIAKYYQDEFFPLLSDHLPEGEKIEFDNYRPESQAGRYLQNYYIANNPNPLGEKEKLIDTGDGSEYTEAHIEYHPKFKEIIEKFGYYDLFLINYKTKDIVYSVFKETDYGTNLQTGAYSQSGLAEVVEKVLHKPTPGKIEISDFRAYRPSYEAPAAFIAAPIYSGSNLIGILAIQIPINQINQIVGNDEDSKGSSLGQTGENYIVGSDNLMRSVSRFWLEEKEQFKTDIKERGTSEATISMMEFSDSTVGLQEVKTPILQSALSGEEGIDITKNYRGKEVLVSYAPLNLKGVEWVIFSEMETEEAFAPLRKLQITLLIAGMIFLLLSALIADFASRLFFQPVRHLIARAKKIEAGELDTEITIDSQAEFGELARILSNVTKNLIQTNRKLAANQQENKFLLKNILPDGISERKIRGESLIVDQLKKVTIVYVHLVGVGNLKWMSPEQVITLLTELVDEFDAIAQNYGLEKQKATGTDYMAVCGLSQAILDQEKRAVDFSQAIFKIVKDKKAEHKSILGLKITIHAGSVTAGIVGRNKFSYNFWGETVDLATQLYNHTPRNKIVVTLPLYERLADQYTFIPDLLEIDNFGKVRTWMLVNVEKIEISQVDLVQSSFAKVVPILDQAGELFYTHLFEVAPSFRPLFKGNMENQQRKLMSTLAIAVEGLGNPEGIIPTLQKLGRSHAGYGVKEEYYETVGETLLWTLEQGLGEDFTPSVRAAWTEAYRFLSEIMKEAAAELKTDNAPKLKVTSDNN